MTVGTVNVRVTVDPDVVALGFAEIPSLDNGTLVTVTFAVGAAEP